jgi:CcmD family protein
MLRKLAFLVTFLMIGGATFAQGTEMADQLRSSGRIYVVVATIAIVFIGLAIYLFTLDRRLNRLEKNKD